MDASVDHDAAIRLNNPGRFTRVFVETRAGEIEARLSALASQPDRVFAKPTLLQAVWGYNGDEKIRTLDSHASRLRRKLGAAGAGEMVINTWGIGYRLWDRLDPDTFPPLAVAPQAA
jgi:DNA-binding response OmpR family regulator